MAVEVAVAVVGRHLHQVVQLLLPEREALHVHDLDARPAVDPLRVRGGVLAGERLRERREVVALGADVRRERHHRLLIHFPNQVLDEALDALDWRHPLDRPVLGDADARDALEELRLEVEHRHLVHVARLGGADLRLVLRVHERRLHRRNAQLELVLEAGVGVAVDVRLLEDRPDADHVLLVAVAQERLHPQLVALEGVLGA